MISLSIPEVDGKHLIGQRQKASPRNNPGVLIVLPKYYLFPLISLSQLTVFKARELLC